MLLKSAIVCCFISLLLVSQTFAQKSPKYAFIVQNTKFDNDSWYKTGDLGSISESGQTISNLLTTQGFTNIVVRKNLTSDEFRNAFNKFISSLPPGATCVVYLCSHGNKVHDNSGDEKIADPNQNDTDDEVFVCKDTPYDSKSINTRQQTDDKGLFDYSPNAIIDDEIGRFNEKILEKIGKDGHYLLLADFCYSDRSEKGENKSANIVLKDASYFVEANSLLFIKKSLNTAPFIVMAASNQLMQVNTSPNRISYFVAAIQYAFEAIYPSDTPSYLSFYLKFRDYLKSIKKGSPSIQLKPDTKVAQLPMFKGESTFKGFMVLLKSNGSQPTGIKPPKTIKKAVGDEFQEVSFTLANPFLFEKGYTVNLFENSIKKAEGLVTDIEEDAIVIKFPQGIQAEKITSIHISERTKEAIKKFQAIQSREELGAVLKLFHNSSLAVEVKDCINQYELLADHTIRLNNNNNCLPSAAFKTLSLKDNISISVKIPDGYFYDIFDVTATNGVRSCYLMQDPNTDDTVPLFRTQQPDNNIFRSKITPPLGASALWVVMSDVAFDGHYLKEYLFDSDPKQNTPLQEYQKYQLWEIIKHIRYFHEIKYTVVEK
ncbi:caspase family protein [Flectobacillus major]|uniref:caspase family protein n=1 Tax=Flectobacillus major TaxID=103 RepID=UPI00041E49F4|nr:caspase family protein [Flectobacillus major]